MTQNDPLFDDEEDKKAYTERLNQLDKESLVQISRSGLSIIGFWSLHKELEAEIREREKSEVGTSTNSESGEK